MLPSIGICVAPDLKIKFASPNISSYTLPTLYFNRNVTTKNKPILRNGFLYPESTQWLLNHSTPTHQLNIQSPNIGFYLINDRYICLKTNHCLYCKQIKNDWIAFHTSIKSAAEIGLCNKLTIIKTKKTCVNIFTVCTNTSDSFPICSR